MSVSGSKLTTAIALDFERILKDWQAFLTKFLIHFGFEKSDLVRKNTDRGRKSPHSEL